MERKIGEIFEYNGEWYQCIGNPYNECTDCDFCFEIGRACVRQIVGQCSMSNRSDGLSVVFKKLEKVGEPFTSVGKLYQHYKVFEIDNVCGDSFWCVHNYKTKTLTIEIKQNKEDMEDLDKIKVRDYTKVEELNVMEEKKLNLKPFDLQKAREGKPVCTRDGRKARIICFDFRISDGICIIAAIECGKTETIFYYDLDGKCRGDGNNKYDLMMLPEKKEGWVNIYNRYSAELTSDGYFYFTKEEALSNIENDGTYVKTIKMSWEE